MNEELKEYLLETVVPLGKQVGHGAYGYVEKVSVSGTVCAAKKVHRVLIHNHDEGVEVFKRRFYSECKIMSQLRHPHIVQFLGVYLPSAEEIKKEESFELSVGNTPTQGLSLPWLIMEFLPINLDDFLKKKSLIPFSLKTSLLLDIAKGLYYLHSRKPPIIHRDLTAKNVLITPALEAKIADFGVARIVNPVSTTMSAVPGAVVYMPPEVQSRDNSSAHYSTSIDIFSFGVNILYIIIQEFPDKLKQQVLSGSSNNLIAVSEVQRRERYFDKAHTILADSSKPEHRLIKLAEVCLSNSPFQRPNIDDLYHELSSIKGHNVDPRDRLIGTDHSRQNGETHPEWSAEVQVNGGPTHPSYELELLQERNRISELEGRLKDFESLNIRLASENGMLEESKRRVEEELREKEEEIGQLQVTYRGQIEGLEGELKTCQGQLDARVFQMERLEQQLVLERELSVDRLKTIKLLEEQPPGDMVPDREKIEQLNANIEYLKQQIFRRDEENKHLKAEAQLLRDQMMHQQATIERREEELSRCLRNLGLRGHQFSLRESGITVKLPLYYQRCNEVPAGFHYGQCVVYDQRYLLYGGGMSTVENMRKIFCYNFRRTSWSEFSTYSYEQFSLAVVRNRLFVVGGYSPLKDEYSSFVSEWKDGSWVQMKDRPLPVSRCDAVTIGYKSYLVVAGGFNGVPLDRVDVLDLETQSLWHMLPSLPQPAYALQSCSYRTNGTAIWYLMSTSRGCGLDRRKPVYAVSLKDLIDDAVSWETIPDPPLDDAGAVAFKGHLMAVGGHDQHATKKDIHMYFPGTNEWLRVGELQHVRHSCSCVSLSEKKFVVVGGKEEETEYSCRVYQYNLRQQ